MLIVRAKVVTRRLLIISFCLSVLWAGSLCQANEQSDKKIDIPKSLEGIWEPDRYIGLDEIEPGMEAYCLTEYGVAGIEQFSLKVVDVVRNIDPGMDAILVEGTDERFIHTGPVAGCSGSPVYIDGRLAGALAFAWTYSKDPLYGVTPIEEMLKVGRGPQAGHSGQTTPAASFSQSKMAEEIWSAFDFTKPIDFAEIDKQFRNGLSRRSHNPGGVNPLPCPLIISGLPSEACEQLSELVEPFGLMVVAGGSGGSQSTAVGKKAQLVPGGCLVVPLVSGDISMTAVGTVTEVIDDKVYGFGHHMLGYGQVDLPMATGKVHTVVSTVSRSFKFASPVETVGALTADESKAVLGRIGAKAKMIPLTIRIDRYNDIEPRVYNCDVAYNRSFTPRLFGLAASGAALQLGTLPPDHMIEYEVTIGVEGFEPITFENVSTSRGLTEMLAESIGSIELLMNNPFKKVDIKSVDFDIRIEPKNIISHIWLVDVSDSKVKAGQEIRIETVLESFLAEKKKYQFSLKVPDELTPGKYNLIVCGSSEYERFLRKAVPYRFIAQDTKSLVKALKDALSFKRDKLYCLMVLPPSGVTVEKAELPDLPATKALVLQNDKRALKTLPYQHWLEKSLETGTVVIDKKIINITVEKQ